MPGFDAQYAGDNQLLFNSSFPILQIKILSELYCMGVGNVQANQGGEYIGTIGSSTTRVFRWYHGLGYPPFFLLIGSSGVIFDNTYAVDENYIIVLVVILQATGQLRTEQKYYYVRSISQKILNILIPLCH